MLGQVRLELEVGVELAGAELALVGAVDHNYLLGRSLALLVLVGLHLRLRMPVLRTLRIGQSRFRALLRFHRIFCKSGIAPRCQGQSCKSDAGSVAGITFTIRSSI